MKKNRRSHLRIRLENIVDTLIGDKIREGICFLVGHEVSSLSVPATQSHAAHSWRECNRCLNTL